jgi:vitamin B12 transporter
MRWSKFALIFACLSIFIFISTTVFAAMSPEEKSFLSMYFTDQELQVISATRSLQSINRVAENIEVVTARDIELMNAHTLADVLNTVNGVEVSFGGASPGSKTLVQIQGSDPRHVAVFLDGIPLNDLGGSVAHAEIIPVQNIERIEIIKGPGSSAWGSSLGGVVNIITKSPGTGNVNGTLSTSYGERETGDFRAEAYGKVKNFGYYLDAGRLRTDGLRSLQAFSEDNLYAKLTYDFSKGTQLLFASAYMKGRGEEDDWGDGVTYSNRFENLLSSLSLHSSLGSDVALDVSLWGSKRHMAELADAAEYQHDDNNKYGANARITWKYVIHTVVVGTDYQNGTVKDNTFNSAELKLRTTAIFVNDTIAIGKVTVVPGVRYDDTNISSSFFSPSLGATYEIAKETLLRAYVARGFNIPPLEDTDSDSSYFRHNPDLKVERVWSYQVGAETGILKYLWLKVDGFRHDVKDAIEQVYLSPSVWTYENLQKVRRQGVDAEIKTVPFYNFVLSVGATFIHTEDRDTGRAIKGVPTYTYDLGLRYDDKKSFRALLKGHYIWWNQDSSMGAKYSSMIFDINMIKDLYRHRDSVIEAFAAGHNIFNGKQDWYSVYVNADRWFEAGVRYKF